MSVYKRMYVQYTVYGGVVYVSSVLVSCLVLSVTCAPTNPVLRYLLLFIGIKAHFLSAFLLFCITSTKNQYVIHVISAGCMNLTF